MYLLEKEDVLEQAAFGQEVKVLLLFPPLPLPLSFLIFFPALLLHAVLHYPNAWNWQVMCCQQFPKNAQLMRLPL